MSISENNDISSEEHEKMEEFAFQQVMQEEAEELFRLIHEEQCELSSEVSKYIDMGYYVLPCNERDKTPATPNGVHDATNNRGAFNQLSKEVELPNVAIAGGRGVIIIDVDEKGDKHGIADINRIFAEAGEPSPIKSGSCPMAKTPSGGYHLFYRCENASDYGNSVGIAYQGKNTAIDIRAGGGYVVAFPSTISAGDNVTAYEWVRPLVPVANLPELPECLKKVLPKKNDNPQPPTGKPQSDFRDRITTPIPNTGISATDRMRRVYAYLNETEPAIEHQNGHTSLYTALGRASWGFDLNEDETRQAANYLNETRCKPPVKPKDLDHKIEDAMTKWKNHQGKPRGHLWTESRRNSVPEVDAGFDRMIENLRANAAAKRKATSTQQETPAMSENDDNQWGETVDEYEDFYEQGEFPVESLPRDMKNYVEELSKSLGRPPQMIVSQLLPALAGAIGTARNVWIAGDWVEPCILWGVMIATSAGRKTSVFNLAGKLFFERFDKMAEKDYKEKSDVYDMEMERYKNLVRAYKEGNSSALPTPTKENIPPKPMNAKRMVSDSTVEALAVFLSCSLRGRCWARDELSQGILSIGQYTKGAKNGNLGFILEAYEGKSYERERVGDGCTEVERNSISVFGGMQPAVLRDIAKDKALLSTGFWARFMFAQVDGLPGKSPDDRNFKTDPSLMQDVFDKLFELKAESGDWEMTKPTTVKVSEEAYQVILGDKAYYEGLTRKYHGTLFESFTGKMCGRTARIALVLHCVENASRCPQDDMQSEISPETMEKAVTINRWFSKEAWRVYKQFPGANEDLNGDSRQIIEDERAAREFVKRLTSEGRRCTRREVLRNSESVKRGIESLLSKNLAEEVEFSAGGRKGGRKSCVITLTTG